MRPPISIKGCVPTFVCHKKFSKHDFYGFLFISVYISSCLLYFLCLFCLFCFFYLLYVSCLPCPLFLLFLISLVSCFSYVSNVSYVSSCLFKSLKSPLVSSCLSMSHQISPYLFMSLHVPSLGRGMGGEAWGVGEAWGRRRGRFWGRRWRWGSIGGWEAWEVRRRR